MLLGIDTCKDSVLNRTSLYRVPSPSCQAKNSSLAESRGRVSTSSTTAGEVLAPAKLTFARYMLKVAALLSWFVAWKTD